MPTVDLPLILSPEQFEAELNRPELVLVDLCKPEVFAQAHLPRAVHLDYKQIIGIRKPVMGLLPDAADFAAVLATIGATPDKLIVAYDDEGGGRAARFLWTLDVLGHQHFALLDGGIHAWAAQNRPLTNEIYSPAHGHYDVSFGERGVADRVYILAHLDDPAIQLVDTRTPEEYNGTKKLAVQAGHIPGAVNFNWTDALDLDNQLLLRDQTELRTTLEGLGITTDKEIIVYCQSHHRSAHTYIMLKQLGYRRIRGYPGAWSDWGNQADTPVE
ncbi:MAG: sulfurtransferase [Acidiferrobacterales bacterium]|jgi:thiosulfate/3-mercaptopyruvate sulfurtransferase|nr:sulfurtransferase [Acidiferrobacterales bacterium]